MRVNLRSLIVFSVLFIFATNSLMAQVDPSEGTVENVESADDQQLFGYYQQLKSKGYSDEQIKTLARAKGVSADKISDFENRISAIKSPKDVAVESNENALEISDEQLADKDGRLLAKPKSSIFGLDFFSNDNISFTPNLNLSTPVNYKLGPGDELVISIWGAAERTYSLSIDREGTIRVPNIGPIQLNGVTIEAATSKIRGSLSRIYNGLNAPVSSPYKINLGVSLASVRTVQINIIGEVNTPGTYSLSSLSTVLNALYAAGGPTDKGTLRNIKLVRNGQEAVSFDMYKYLTEGSQEGNIIIRDQDVIIVSPYLSRISIQGAVKRPGLFELKPNETLNSLLKFTSGFTSTAYKDIVIIERISGDARRVVEIDLSKANSEILIDGDLIEVQSILGGFQNKVQIEGAVARPGVFELTEGLTVSKLIEKADGVLGSAFLGRGVILRSNDGVSMEVVSFSISEILNGDKNDVLLKKNDVLKIYDKYNTKEESYISISGAVINPKRIPFIKNLTVEDMVLLSGGFTDDADKANIDIYRKVIGEKTEMFLETIEISSNGINKVTDLSSNSLVLKPNDRISVRYLKGHRGELFVSVTGQVNYSGSYGIENKMMRISDVLNLSGGVTDYAFVKGASLSRINPFYKEKAQIKVAKEVKENISDEDSDILLKNTPSLQIGIDLMKILENPGSKYDMILKNGDVLNIPSIKETVKVDGEVLVPSLIRYDNRNNLKEYISNSGGFSENARKSKVYVIYLNGEIVATKNFLFFKFYPKLEPGSLVIVPSKPDRDRNLSAQEAIGFTTSLTTLALLLNSFL